MSAEMILKQLMIAFAAIAMTSAAIGQQSKQVSCMGTMFSSRNYVLVGTPGGLCALPESVAKEGGCTNGNFCVVGGQELDHWRDPALGGIEVHALAGSDIVANVVPTPTPRYGGWHTISDHNDVYGIGIVDKMQVPWVEVVTCLADPSRDGVQCRTGSHRIYAFSCYGQYKEITGAASGAGELVRSEPNSLMRRISDAACELSRSLPSPWPDPNHPNEKR